jgi:hypothetical protein
MVLLEAMYTSSGAGERLGEVQTAQHDAAGHKDQSVATPHKGAAGSAVGQPPLCRPGSHARHLGAASYMPAGIGPEGPDLQRLALWLPV